MSDRLVYADAPARVYWEITRSCDLACQHCRAEAAPCADPRELDHATGLRILAMLAKAEPKPHVVLTGGDPLKRADLFELIAAGRALGLGISVSPSATPLLTPAVIRRLKDAGVEAISLSIDGASAESHDAIRQVPGTFARTMEAAKAAREADLPFQVNTLVSAETIDEMEGIETLVRSIGAARWSLFFLVTVGRGTVLNPIDGDRAESLLRWLAERSMVPGGPIYTTTEAPHYRRVVSQLHLSGGAARPAGRGHAGRPGHGAGIRDGNGVMFIAHDGEVSPSGFLPVSAGNVKIENPLTIYRESLLFRTLRDVDGFRGRCGRCEYRAACGGSRARAWAATDDVLAEDPLCTHQPRAQETLTMASPPTST